MILHTCKEAFLARLVLVVISFRRSFSGIFLNKNLICLPSAYFIAQKTVTYYLTCHLTWPSTNVEVSVEVQSLGAMHLDETISRALKVLVAVRIVRVIITTDLQGVLICQANAIRFCTRR